MDDFSILGNQMTLLIEILINDNWPNDERRWASNRIESLQNDNPFTASKAFLWVVKEHCNSLIGFYALRCLRRLVHLRWHDFTRMWGDVIFIDIFTHIMSCFILSGEHWRFEAARFVAEIIKREGRNLFQKLQFYLSSMSNQGPILAEMLSNMVNFLVEVRQISIEDLAGHHQQIILLNELPECVTNNLSLLESVLWNHSEGALIGGQSQTINTLNEHGKAVVAALRAVNAWAEFATLSHRDVYKCCQVVFETRCTNFLFVHPFRLVVCEFCRIVFSRNASVSELDHCMKAILEKLIPFSKSCLNTSDLTENDFEFAEKICECLTSFGLFNFHCISQDTALLPRYLQQMLDFFKHHKFALHFQSLSFWLALMGNLISKLKVTSHPTGDASSTLSDDDRRTALGFVNHDLCRVILDASFQRMPMKEKVSPGVLLRGSLELWKDDFAVRLSFKEYQSKLLELIELFASYKPLLASDEVCKRIIKIIKPLFLSQRHSQDPTLMESMQSILKCVVSVVFNGSNEFGVGNSEIQFQLCRNFEVLRRQLLLLKLSEPALVVLLGHYLDALVPFLKYNPVVVMSVLGKFFELLRSLPSSVKDEDASTNSARHARSQICTCILHVAKAADKSIMPHLRGIADILKSFTKDFPLHPEEQDLLIEAFRVMASAAGIEQGNEDLDGFVQAYKYK